MDFAAADIIRTHLEVIKLSCISSLLALHYDRRLSETLQVHTFMLQLGHPIRGML